MRAAIITPTQAHMTPLNPSTSPLIVTTAKQLAANPPTKPARIPHFQQYSS